VVLYSKKQASNAEQSGEEQEKGRGDDGQNYGLRIVADDERLLYDLELRERVEAEEGSNDGRPCGTDGNASTSSESNRPDDVEAVCGDEVGDSGVEEKSGRLRRGEEWEERERDLSVDFLGREIETVLVREGLRWT